MSDKRELSIGIFDSGIGGLTVMKELMKALPYEPMTYFGDTARLPYGAKSREVIIRYSIENAIFLMEQNIKMLVVACNTASTFALERLQQMFNVPVLGVIEPGAEKAAKTTTNRHIAVLGTDGTIKAGVYPQKIKRHLPDAQVLSVACPLFVPLVEERFVHHPAAKLIVKEYLQPLHDHPIDTILLGCTHYPILKRLIQEELGNHIKIVDSASSCAENVVWTLKNHDLLASGNHPANCRYFVSDDPKKFRDNAQNVFGFTLPEVQSS
jgi:glutamate racemase